MSDVMTVMQLGAEATSCPPISPALPPQWHGYVQVIGPISQPLVQLGAAWPVDLNKSAMWNCWNTFSQ
jgi:hypothetical protein